MSAPAEKTIGTEEAITIAPIPPESLTLLPDRLQGRGSRAGETAFIGTLASQAIATSSAGLQLHRLGLIALVGLRVGVEALARGDPETALGDESPQGDRRGETLAVLLLERSRSARALESSPSTSAFQNGGSRPRRGSRPAPAIIPTSMSRTEQTPSSTSRQASISARQLNMRDQLLGVRLGVAGDRLLAVFEEALAAALGAELAFADKLLQALVDVEGLAVGVVEMLGDVEDGVEAEQVGEEEGAHRRHLGGSAIAASIAFSERPCSSWARQISPIVAIRMRLTTKPGTSPQTIGCFLIAWAKL